MNCPFCGHLDSRVVDSRETESKEAIRRRRECFACGQRFTTYEMIEQIPITVVKRNGVTELFDSEKLLRGLTRACTKRDVAVERLQSVDLVAYIRFASVYRQFDSIEGFKEELEQLAKEGIR